MRHLTAFRLAGWFLLIAGFVYIVLGLAAQARGGTAPWSFFVLGLVGIVVGTSVLRWTRRKLQP
ncbi:MAG TPA: hypothetical protein VFT04_00495 [Gemmatimonadales bacterium]|nr:hypothetical protein [Gemmatimonadales bacterium]